MIHSIDSNLDTFKTLRFHEGLNILLAEMTRGATTQQTRNAAGKTSLVELVHFLLEGAVSTKSIFRAKAQLFPYEFRMNIDVKDTLVTVSRSGETWQNVRVVPNDFLPIAPDQSGEEDTYKSTTWPKIVGNQFFNLPIEKEADNSPSVGSLFSYFVRRVANSAFSTPHKQHGDQRTWDWQVNLSYLLGFDWTISQGIEKCRKRNTQLDNAKNQLEQKAAELRSELTVANRRKEELTDTVENFHVLPQYEIYETEAVDIQEKLDSIASENFADQRLIKRLTDDIDSEHAPSLEQLKTLYNEAEVVLPDIVQCRYDELEQFHQSIVANRASYLHSQLDDTNWRIAQRDKERERLENRRTEVMGILKAGGAWSALMQLQDELTKKTREVERLRDSLKEADRIDDEKLKLKQEQTHLVSRLRQDITEQNELLQEAVLAFERVSKRLYGKDGAGYFKIDPTNTGPKFEVSKQGDRSEGVKKMQIFCFDMMLSQLIHRRGYGPGFLIHDSHLFDGVDPRQVAEALKVGAELADEIGFQYIVTLNSNDYPSNGLGSTFKERHVLDVELTDASDDGGLFGIRF